MMDNSEETVAIERETKKQDKTRQRLEEIKRKLERKREDDGAF
jgi:hypothetical protein